MLDWDKLRIFHAVATAGSFTHAGAALGVSQSAVSRQVSALEESLDTALFYRHARGLALTEQGEILFKTVSDMLLKLAATENALLETKNRPRGPLKITAPVAIGATWLTAHMREFSELYPEIVVSVLADDREFDLAMREADVAIRLFPTKRPDLVQKKIATLHHSLYAAGSYLRAHGTPKKPADLSTHRLITYDETARAPFAEVNWILHEGRLGSDERRSAFKINHMLGMLKAAEAGIGIAGLPDHMARGAVTLTRVLPELKGPQTEVYFIYPAELRSSKRVGVFRDFLLRKLGEDGLD